MHVPKNTVVSIYDALHELAHVAYPELLEKARVLGSLLGTAGVGGVTRAGSPITTAVLLEMEKEKSVAVVISPAATALEHIRAFHLPQTPLLTIYGGRGALGADVTALTSSSAVLIVGTEEEPLAGILGCADGHGIPIAILCTTDPAPVQQMIAERFPSLLPQVYLSGDPASVVQYLTQEIRKRTLQNK